MSANAHISIRTGRAQVLAFLVALQFFYAWSWSSSDILRPAFRAALQLSLSEVGAGYSAQVVGALVGALTVVRIEHMLGRRHTFALLAALTGVSLLAGIVVSNWPIFLVQRFAVGICGGAVFPLTIGLITELFESRVRGRLASLIDSTYYSAVVALSLASGQAGIGGWKLLLLIGGIPPLVFAIFAYRLIPEYTVHGAQERPVRSRASVFDLFAAPHRARTLALSAMLGANACGSQAFSGWLTTYLYEVAQFSGPEVGGIVACQFVGSAAGCIGWGWAIDRFGRRAGAFGLGTAGIATAAFLLSPPSPILLSMIAATYGIAFSAVVSVGPWLAELYPPALRTAATSMFQWGRFISLVVPPLTGGLAAYGGLPAAMATAIIAFAVSAMIWSRLPETLVREPGRVSIVKGS
jgi:MFS family permease